MKVQVFVLVAPDSALLQRGGAGRPHQFGVGVSSALLSVGDRLSPLFE